MGIQEESILTQMIFYHSLRLRLATHKVKKTLESTPTTPKDDGLDQPTSAVDSSTQQDAQSDSASTGPVKGKESTDDKDNDNISGKVTNLMSSDMNTIVNAPLVLLAGKYMIQRHSPSLIDILQLVH